MFFDLGGEAGEASQAISDLLLDDKGDVSAGRSSGIKFGAAVIFCIAADTVDDEALTAGFEPQGLAVDGIGWDRRKQGWC